ncbi:Lysozyme OS=Sphingobium scionense OX=1404341 GN=GGQ90_001795 PE=4 SV=1 [Sphingobium scionense]
MIPLPASIRPYLLGAAGIAILAAAIWVWRIDSLRASHKADAANVRREYALFREQVTAKATEALTAQKAVNAAQEQKWKERAHAADQMHETELASANAAAERYIRDNRLLRQAVVRGAGGEAGGAAQGDSAQGGDRSGAAADLVAVTADDVRICTENTRRLIDVRDWALGLNP